MSFQLKANSGKGSRVSGTQMLLWPVVVMGLLGGCEINKPEMPTFDTALSVPLGVERIDIMEAVEDEDYLVVDGNGGLSFFIEGDPDTMDFDFDLSADVAGQTVQEGLGNFDLPAPDPLDYEFLLGDIWAPAAGQTDLATAVPPFPIAVVSGDQDIPDIDNAMLESGSLTVTVSNGLPVPISAPNGPDQLIIYLEDPADGAVVTTLTFGTIAAGAVAEQTADLAGATLPGTIRVRLAGGSPGSGGQVVTVNGTDAIDVNAAFSALVVSSAQAVVEAQTFHSSFDTELPADYEITDAVISSGTLDVTLTNDMPVPCTAVLSWSQLVNLSDQPLQAIYNLAPGQTLLQTVDFAGRILQAGPDPITALTADLDINTPGSSGATVTLDSGDGLTADVAPATINFSSVTGEVPAYDVAIEPIEEEIDLPDEMDGLELTAATMVLRLTNTSGLPGDVDLTLTGVAENGSTRDLHVNEQILPSISREPGVTSIVLDQTNSSLVDFLNNLPEQITLDGTVAVGGDGASGTVHANDYAAIAWDITAPVEVIITGSTIAGDPDDLGIDQDVRDIINDHARGARVETEILNHMPVGVELRILAAVDTTNISTNPLLVIGPLTLAPATVDPVTHMVLDAVISRPIITLTELEARVFGLEGLHTVVEATLPSTDGQPVRMMSTDYIEVRGIVQLDVEVNDEW